MNLSHNVFDVWVFRRTSSGIEYLLLHTSLAKANRYFNGGRFWQIPSNVVEDAENVVNAIVRCLSRFGLQASAVWAAEHAYTIYNRRFDTIQIISVFAAEVSADVVELEPEEHSDYRWCAYDQALSLVHYRGLKDGLRSTYEYVTGVSVSAPELRLM